MVAMKAVGYVRVSTEKQAGEGVSLEAQQAKILAMAVVQGVEIGEMIVDAGESAKSLGRPGMETLLKLVDQGKVKTVIVAKLDRLTRSVKDLAVLLDRFQKRGVALVSVAESLDTASAAGRLVLNIMVSVSQWEREAIGERTKDAMSHKKAKGERVGNLPYGKALGSDGIHLVENQAERNVLAKMRELRDSGLSLRAIAARLNEAGSKTRRGVPWRHEYVANALKAA